MRRHRSRGKRRRRRKRRRRIIKRRRPVVVSLDRSKLEYESINQHFHKKEDTDEMSSS